MFKVAKVVSRIAHMVSTALLSGIIIMTYLFELGPVFASKPGLRKLNMILGPILIVSGFANIFLIKEGKKLQKNQKPWVGMLHLKLLLSCIILTPVFKPILQIFVKGDVEQTKQAFQFYFICFAYLYSAGIKYFREDVHNNFNNKATDDLQKKVDQLKGSETAAPRSNGITRKN